MANSTKSKDAEVILEENDKEGCSGDAKSRGDTDIQEVAADTKDPEDFPPDDIQPPCTRKEETARTEEEEEEYWVLDDLPCREDDEEDWTPDVLDMVSESSWREPGDGLKVPGGPQDPREEVPRPLVLGEGAGHEDPGEETGHRVLEEETGHQGLGEQIRQRVLERGTGHEILDEEIGHQVLGEGPGNEIFGEEIGGHQVLGEGAGHRVLGEGTEHEILEQEIGQQVLEEKSGHWDLEEETGRQALGEGTGHPSEKTGHRVLEEETGRQALEEETGHLLLREETENLVLGEETGHRFLGQVTGHVLGQETDRPEVLREETGHHGEVTGRVPQGLKETGADPLSEDRDIQKSSSEDDQFFDTYDTQTPKRTSEPESLSKCGEDFLAVVEDEDWAALAEDYLEELPGDDEDDLLSLPEVSAGGRALSEGWRTRGDYGWKMTVPAEPATVAEDYWKIQQRQSSPVVGAPMDLDYDGKGGSPLSSTSASSLSTDDESRDRGENVGSSPPLPAPVAVLKKRWAAGSDPRQPSEENQTQTELLDWGPRGRTAASPSPKGAAGELVDSSSDSEDTETCPSVGGGGPSPPGVQCEFRRALDGALERLGGERRLREEAELKLFLASELLGGRVQRDLDSLRQGLFRASLALREPYRTKEDVARVIREKEALNTLLEEKVCNLQTQVEQLQTKNREQENVISSLRRSNQRMGLEYHSHMAVCTGGRQQGLRYRSRDPLHLSPAVRSSSEGARW